MTKILAQIYEAHHKEKDKYGFSHHLTMKGSFFRSSVGRGKIVLDLGSRDGVLTETFFAGNTVTCVDVDSKAIQSCRQRLRVTAIQHDLNYPLPFAAESFDVIVAADVLEHVFFGDGFLKEVRRVLANDGVFLGSTPNAFFWSNRLRFALGNDPHDFLDPTHVRHFSLGSLKQMLSREFSRLDVMPYGRHKLAHLQPAWFAGDFFWRASK